MRRVFVEVGLASLLLMGRSAQVQAQAQPQQAPEGEQAYPSLQVNARAVVVDVIVTDSSGKPVTGLSKDAFAVTEQGKPQKIAFFEENGPVRAAQPVAEMPKLPPDVFTNFSPFPQPPAVNVLLLDSLNTRMENQSYVHEQALKFLKSAKPGTRSAIFAMGLGLHFIQGFNDDPAVLAAALKDKKNNWVETSVALKGQDETNAQQDLIGMMNAQEPYGPSGGAGASAAPAEMITALQNFIQENDTSRSFDRIYVTMANLQRLATFLQGFPGRKNIIWFAEKVPSPFLTGGLTGNPGTDKEIKRTLVLLATARAAIYPVDPRGASNYALYTAENNLSHANSQPSQILGAGGSFAQSMTNQGEDRNTDQLSAEMVAKDSGGRAFANMNGISDVIAKVTSDSSRFYTLSYTPTDAKMDGSFRKIDVKVEGGRYSLSYRRGYFAEDTALPGSALSLRDEKLQKLASENPGQIDPLLPYMDLGMPQSEQILYKIRIVPTAAGDKEPADKKDKKHYQVDFAIDLKDLALKGGPEGLHKGALNISLVVYDRYGTIVSREDHLVDLNIKPDAYAIFQNAGVQLHAKLAVPNGNYWLRTGVFDRSSQKVGTMEFPLGAVKALDAAPAGSK